MESQRSGLDEGVAKTAAPAGRCYITGSMNRVLATGDLILEPDHRQEPNAPAAWRHFEILTNLRAELARQRR